jgi:ATP-binding cassette subfamily C protein CydD
MKVNSRLLLQARTTRLELSLTIALGIVRGFILVGQARIISMVVNGVFLQGLGLPEVTNLLILFAALSLLRAALTWGVERCAYRAAMLIKHSLREQLTERIFSLGPAFTRRERSGELTNTLTEGIEALEAYFSQYLPQLTFAAIVPLTILLFVFPLDLTSGLVLLLTAPLIPIFMNLIADAAARQTERQWISLSRMSAHFLDALQGLTTLKLLGRSHAHAESVASVSDRFRSTTLGVLRVTFLSALVLELIATLSTAIVAVEVGLRLLYGRLAFEMGFFVLLLAPEFYIPLRMLGTRFHAGMSGVTAANRIFDILERPAPEVRQTSAQEISKLDFNIQFDDVHFNYGEDREHALRGVTFSIPAGQQVAIVGPSGAGKSTIAQLLLRFIEPTHGAITVDGIPLESLDISAWRKRISWVPQTPYLFNASILDNIRLADPEASLKRVERAAQLAHADAFIQALHQGYETMVGERGERLSAGQAQRIALARAFLKDASLLILDEATANLDPLHEELVQKSVRDLIRDRTSLVIAHRLSTVQSAETILVISDGRIVEAGKHDHLLTEDGLYRELVLAYRGML